MTDMDQPIASKQQAYTAREWANEEANKLFYDVFKHLTTLNTGAILIVATLLDTLFAEPQWKFLIVAALVGFIVSTVGAVRMMFFQASAVMVMKVQTHRGERLGFLLTVISFLLGITSLVAFTIKNFYG